MFSITKLRRAPVGSSLRRFSFALFQIASQKIFAIIAIFPLDCVCDYREYILKSSDEEAPADLAATTSPPNEAPTETKRKGGNNPDEDETMATKGIEFKVSIASFDGDAWKRLDAARKEVAKIQTEILAAYEKSERAKAAYDLAGFGEFGTKYNPIHRIDNSQILTRINVDMADDNGSKPVKSLYLGEKTINALINGKLLTDDQKKALLKQVGVDLDELSAA